MYEHNARLVEELRVEDPQFFFVYLRMELALFDEMVQRVAATNMRKALSTHCDTHLTEFEVAFHDDSLSNETRMFRMLL